MIVEPTIRPWDLLISPGIQGAELVTITKVSSRDHLYCGYTNGTVKVFSTNNGNTLEKINLYQNGEVIDLKIIDSNIVACTHSEVTVHNLEKNRSISLKGH